MQCIMATQKESNQYCKFDKAPNLLVYKTYYILQSIFINIVTFDLYSVVSKGDKEWNILPLRSQMGDSLGAAVHPQLTSTVDLSFSCFTFSDPPFFPPMFWLYLAACGVLVP